MNITREMVDIRHDQLGITAHRVADFLLGKPERLMVGAYTVSDAGCRVSARYMVEARQSEADDWSTVIHAAQSGDGGSALAVVPYVSEVRLRIVGKSTGNAVHLVLAAAAPRRLV